MIGGVAGENEIRFGLVFRYSSALVLNAAFGKQQFEMIFERKPYPALAPILHREGERKIPSIFPLALQRNWAVEYRLNEQRNISIQ